MLCNRLFIFKIISFLLLGFSPIYQLYAYPNFVSFGYSSCITCHYNPFGHGPLNDYGRALGATTVGDNIFYPKSFTSEQLGKGSGFLWSKSSNDWLRLSLNGRGLYYKNNVGKKTAISNFVVMQGGGSVVLKSDKRNKYIAVFNYSYAPTPRAKPNLDEPNWRSREHYIGARINKNVGLYLGMMDKPFGIRVPDHIAFSRSVTGLAQNDQSHGALIHYNKGPINIGANYFLGNLSQNQDVRQKGLSLQSEFEFKKGWVFGGSYLNSKSDFLKRNISSLHGRLKINKGSSIMLEIGKNKTTKILQSKKNDAYYVFNQNHLLLKKGLFLFFTSEYLRPNTDLEDYLMRIGPGLQWFPVMGMELRTDFLNTRSFSEKAVNDDSWLITAQLNLWI